MLLFSMWFFVVLGTVFNFLSMFTLGKQSWWWLLFSILSVVISFMLIFATTLV